MWSDDEKYYEKYWGSDIPRILSPLKPLEKRVPKKRVPKSVGNLVLPQRSNQMSATAIAIDNFEKTVKQHVAKKVGDTSEILAQIGKLKSSVANPQIYSEEEIKNFLNRRAKALSVLMDNFLVAKLSSQYPLLDNGIFQLKRYLYINTSGTAVEDSTVRREVEEKGDRADKRIETSLFMHAKVGEKTVKIGNYTSTKNWNRKVITVTAHVPVVPVAIQEMGRKALGFYHATIAEIYDKSSTSDLFTTNALPTLETMWIPTAQSLSVEVKDIPVPRRVDPALLMKYSDRYYLVGLWDIKEELPIDSILREFSIGPAKFPKK